MYFSHLTVPVHTAHKNVQLQHARGTAVAIKTMHKFTTDVHLVPVHPVVFTDVVIPLSLQNHQMCNTWWIVP